MGGFVITLLYSFETRNTIGGLATDVNFGTDSRFHLATLLSSSVFTTAIAGNPRTISGTLTVAAPTAYTVTFLDWDGALLGVDTVFSGAAATVPTDPERQGYSFAGWDANFTNVTSDLTVAALYDALPDQTPGPSPGPIRSLSPYRLPTPMARQTLSPKQGTLPHLPHSHSWEFFR